MVWGFELWGSGLWAGLKEGWGFRVGEGILEVVEGAKLLGFQQTLEVIRV